MASPNSTESQKSFGERLRAMREAAGLRSPEAFAQAAGVAKQTVYNWESRLTPPPPSGVQKIAKALGLSTREVLDYHPAPQQPDHVCESTAQYGLRALPNAAELEATCRGKLDAAIKSARGIPERLAYFAEQLSGALVSPAHWRTEDKAAESARQLLDSFGTVEGDESSAADQRGA